MVWNREQEDGMYFLLKWKDLNEDQKTWEHCSNTDCVKLIAHYCKRFHSFTLVSLLFTYFCIIKLETNSTGKDQQRGRGSCRWERKFQRTLRNRDPEEKGDRV